MACTQRPTATIAARGRHRRRRSGYVVPDPRDSNIVYANDEEFIFTRFDRRRSSPEHSTAAMILDGHPLPDRDTAIPGPMPLLVSQHNLT